MGGFTIKLSMKDISFVFHKRNYILDFGKDCLHYTHRRFFEMKVFTSPQQQNQNITALISVHLKSAKVTLLHEMTQSLCGRVIREPGSKYRDQFQLPFLPLSKVV